ncbi:hypothetical protein CFE70_001767 [Pyrenophora teres f. teres 0-1]|uniref:Uncharacterized protein n=1 Tax=Pyrenophora teres f. teres (strain 0-1) TaxID=861557 RepID=E3S816_PYRTT|nr:hypothetical protein PTT_19028 [Pyrenophora teres f. teres 0-1]KAE8842317.1 hypothetical protein HRS9139_01614 [Pyrenophora teres f. teres]KAE8850611.1 hypothetical protein PTNB85_01027 [Pyrenophora teres f. teres]KAE8870027.1 hypothetical protein PTNB29_00371 [Pyrenophora teres f. teres]KAK1915257.1 hypothetical protein P3342_003064 [Pyrenophora teres f. teres]
MDKRKRSRSPSYGEPRKRQADPASMTAIMSVPNSILANPRALLESTEGLQKSAVDLISTVATGSSTILESTSELPPSSAPHYELWTQSTFTIASVIDLPRSSSERQLPENKRNNPYGQVLVPDLSETPESPSGDTDFYDSGSSEYSENSDDGTLLIPPQHKSSAPVSSSRDIAVQTGHQENTDTFGTAASQAMDNVDSNSTDIDDGYYGD